MNLAFLVRRRLKELNIDQRDLAMAAQVTESYISQLLSSKKAPPDPNRTDIYSKIESFLSLEQGELARLARLQRKEELKRRVVEPASPLFKEFRQLTLRKCTRSKSAQIQTVFEKETFGELERFVTQKLLNVAKKVAQEELENEAWLRAVSHLSKRSYEQVRVMILEFLDTDIFNVSLENCVSFLDPLIESWDIDLETFGMEIVLNRRLSPDNLKRFEFVERVPEAGTDLEEGLEEFLRDPQLSRDATPEEVDFLKKLRFSDRRPTPIYYYRELQNLRDPLHFRKEFAENDRISKKNNRGSGSLI